MENITLAELLALLTACYALAVAVVLFSGAVPTKWRTWPVIHGVAWAVPVIVLAFSFLAASISLVILLIIIAATSR